MKPTRHRINKRSKVVLRAPQARREIRAEGYNSCLSVALFKLAQFCKLIKIMGINNIFFLLLIHHEW
jgi:hypothetical protein